MQTAKQLFIRETGRQKIKNQFLAVFGENIQEKTSFRPSE
jgi:hypothetical protein